MGFFPADRAVPQTLDTSTFSLRQLDTSQAAIDYAAYMASPDVIRWHSGGRWSVDGFTLDQEQEQLAMHEERHRARQDFAFILLTPDQKHGLGCVYMLPLLPFLRRAATSAALLAQATETSAMITFWLRQARLGTRLAQQVVAAVHRWLLSDWPFDDHVFRVNHEEHESIQALEQCGLRLRFELTLDKSPYHYSFFGKIAG
jgi:RimJ/RimL family protein N-acetyltransferase